jgi:hypothetical protein
MLQDAYTIIFFKDAILGALIAFLLFTIPGLLVLALFGHRVVPWKNYSALLFAPAIGMSTFGSFSLLVAYIVGFTKVKIIVIWLLFNLILIFLLRENKYKKSSLVISIPGYHYILLYLLIILWSCIVSFGIFPIINDGGLYVGHYIFDHMKMAIVDSIVRDGLPPLNPFYSPDGKRILLIYYYGWHFLTAQIQLLASITAWKAEVASSWFTSFALLGFLMGIAIRIYGKTRAGVFVFLLAMTNPLANILPMIMGQRWKALVGFPPVHGLELLWTQMLWAPQHVYSALCVIALIYFFSLYVDSKNMRVIDALILALIAASGLSASIYVGGIGLIIAMPFFLFNIVKFKSHFFKRRKTIYLCMLAVIFCLILSIPVISSIRSGPPVTQKGMPLSTWIYTSSSLVEKNTLWGIIAHIILFWLQLLPLNLGVVYIIGILSILTFKTKIDKIKIFHILSATAVFIYLIQVQFIRSTIMNNDFGWRCVLVPDLLLIIWAAVAFSEFTGKNLYDKRSRSEDSFLVKRKNIIIPIGYVFLTIGILSTFHKWHIPGPQRSKFSKEYHKDFFEFRHAWQEINKYTEPDSLVQFNPNSYMSKIVTPWPAPSSLALFGNRPVAYTDPESVNVFAFTYNQKQKERQRYMIQSLFESHPPDNVIREAYYKFNIKAILVNRYDPVWPSKAFEQSGLYKLVSSTKHYKIYLAINNSSN